MNSAFVEGMKAWVDVCDAAGDELCQTVCRIPLSVMAGLGLRGLRCRVLGLGLVYRVRGSGCMLLVLLFASASLRSLNPHDLQLQ